MEKKKYQSLDKNIDCMEGNKQLLDHPQSSTDKLSSRAILAQCLVTGAVMMSSASCGMPVGYSAILLPQLKATNGSLTIDDNIGSWIASVHSAATPIGSLLSAVLMDRFGRKLSLQLSAVPLVIGWAIISLAHNHTLLLLGRLLAGMSSGLAAAPGQVLIGEISSPNLRGMLTSVPFASYSFGILLVYALGYMLNWRIVAGASMILPVIAALSFCFLPESPVWLVQNGRYDEAGKNMMWLHGKNTNAVKKHLQQLISRTEKEREANSRTASSWCTLLEPAVLKPFLIMNLFNIMQILSGTYLVVFYAVDILSTIDGGNGEVDTFLAAVLTACVRFIFTILVLFSGKALNCKLAMTLGFQTLNIYHFMLVASMLLCIIGRRTLALTSGLGTAITALCLGTFLYLQAPSCASSSGHFAAVCILAYVAANTVGFLILPGVLLGELYPTRIRGFAGGLTFTIFNIVLFAVTKIFPLLKNAVGVHGIFWIFGGSSLLASLFLGAILPETQGKTLTEIEDYFNDDHILWMRRNNSSNKSTNSEYIAKLHNNNNV